MRINLIFILLNNLFLFILSDEIPESFDSRENGQIVSQKYMIKEVVEDAMPFQLLLLFQCVIV